MNTGCTAALHSERWDLALELNAEILKSTQARGAGDLELARTRFNDYGPLLRLGRPDDCRRLLQGCRAVFESEHDVEMLGRVYSALADLQDKTGDRPGAVGFEEAALRFRYQAGDPEDCAISHHNLSNYLEALRRRPGPDPGPPAGGGPAPGPDRLGPAPDDRPHPGQPGPPRGPLGLAPDFDRIADRVEQVDGVRFRRLFARLDRIRLRRPPGRRLRARRGLGVGPRRARAPRRVGWAEGRSPTGKSAEPAGCWASFVGPTYIRRSPVARIRSCERDPDALTADLDPGSSAVIRRLWTCSRTRLSLIAHTLRATQPRFATRSRRTQEIAGICRK